MNAGEFAKRRARLENEAASRRKGYTRKAFWALVHEAGAATIIVHGRIVGWRMPNGQIVCRKRRYGDQHQADAALFKLVEHEGKRMPQRAYQCPYCEGYHLTSMKFSYQ